MCDESDVRRKEETQRLFPGRMLTALRFRFDAAEVT